MRNVLVLLLCGCLMVSLAHGQETSPVEDLGEGRVRVGNIEIDTRQGSFTVSGMVILQDKIDAPMEFIAVTKGGVKSYEAIIELDTSAIDFNLACILIGLDEANATRPQYHFDPAETLGDPVSMTVAFEIESDQGREQAVVPVESLLAGEDTVGSHQWVYTGSSFYPNGDYLAEGVGTLVGFVHDPESIIQHRRGLGLGDYGAVVLNAEVVPPGQTPVVFTLQRD